MILIGTGILVMMWCGVLFCIVLIIKDQRQFIDSRMGENRDRVLDDIWKSLRVIRALNLMGLDFDDVWR